MILALTGHRPHKLGNEYSMDGPVSQAVRKALREVLLKRKPEKAISGMALGADMMWAEEALELEIPVLAAVPFEGQERTWPPASQVIYREILDHPLVTKVICAPGGATNAVYKLNNRNRYMVDRCGELVAVWDGSSGGTLNTLAYASEVDRPIIYISPTNVARTEWRVDWPETRAA